ncbi:hypothetical protein H7N57_001745 [Staphylococcus pseudintermedius]|nr:hypothetical protein [Staphylococcus pseudintermedius]
MRKENQNAPQALGFRWNGKAFTCSMGGFYACAYYCGMRAIVSLIAGARCEVICGTVFTTACALS